MGRFPAQRFVVRGRAPADIETIAGLIAIIELIHKRKTN
jgi:hypothetical protein